MNPVVCTGFRIQCFFDPVSGMEKIQIRDKHPGSYYPELYALSLLWNRIRDPIPTF
jgi:hypothetical protein